MNEDKVLGGRTLLKLKKVTRGKGDGFSIDLDNIVSKADSAWFLDLRVH